jgi:hypothetical protein
LQEEDADKMNAAFGRIGKLCKDEAVRSDPFKEMLRGRKVTTRTSECPISTHMFALLASVAKLL